MPKTPYQQFFERGNGRPAFQEFATTQRPYRVFINGRYRGVFYALSNDAAAKQATDNWLNQGNEKPVNVVAFLVSD